MGRFTGEYSKCDPYNRSNGRNVDNSNTDEYNCAGFALRTYSWYCPNENPLREIFEDYFERGRDDFDGIMNEVTDMMVDTMLTDFDGQLRVIEDASEVFPDEELIAFRVAANYDEIDYDPDFADFDFHYQVLRDGRWQEKNGDSPITCCDSPIGSEYWDAGWIVYNGPMVLFAKIID